MWLVLFGRSWWPCWRTPVTSTPVPAAVPGSASARASPPPSASSPSSASCRPSRGPTSSAPWSAGVIGLFAARLVWGALAGPRHRGRATSCTRCSSSSSATWASSSAAQKGEWFEPARIIAAFRDSTRAPPVQDPRHLRDHRRPHRRHLRDGLPGRHAGGAAVRAARAAAGGGLLGRPEAQPRPPRARHPAEDPEDGARRRADRGDGLPGRPRGGPEAHRAGAPDGRQDRHQRLQPQQGRPAARRPRPQHQRAGQLAQAGGAARRGDEGLHHQGRQGARPGRRLPRRRHDGGGGPGARRRWARPSRSASPACCRRRRAR